MIIYGYYELQKIFAKFHNVLQNLKNLLGLLDAFFVIITI